MLINTARKGDMIINKIICLFVLFVCMQVMHLLFPHGLHEPVGDELDDDVNSALTSRSFKLLGLRKAKMGGSGKIMDSLGCFSISFQFSRMI